MQIMRAFVPKSVKERYYKVKASFQSTPSPLKSDSTTLSESAVATGNEALKKAFLERYGRGSKESTPGKASPSHDAQQQANEAGPARTAQKTSTVSKTRKHRIPLQQLDASPAKTAQSIPISLQKRRSKILFEDEQPAYPEYGNFEEAGDEFFKEMVGGPTSTVNRGLRTIKESRSSDGRRSSQPSGSILSKRFTELESADFGTENAVSTRPSFESVREDESGRLLERIRERPTAEAAAAPLSRAKTEKYLTSVIRDWADGNTTPTIRHDSDAFTDAEHRTFFADFATRKGVRNIIDMEWQERATRAQAILAQTRPDIAKSWSLLTNAARRERLQRNLPSTQEIRQARHIFKNYVVAQLMLRSLEQKPILPLAIYDRLARIDSNARSYEDTVGKPAHAVISAARKNVTEFEHLSADTKTFVDLAERDRLRVANQVADLKRILRLFETTLSREPVSPGSKGGADRAQLLADIRTTKTRLSEIRNQLGAS